MSDARALEAATRALHAARKRRGMNSRPVMLDLGPSLIAEFERRARSVREGPGREDGRVRRFRFFGARVDALEG
jgi:hypothetical protein